MLPNNIIGVEVSMLSSKCGRLDNDWVKTCCFSAKHAALSGATCLPVISMTSTIKIQLSLLV